MKHANSVYVRPCPPNARCSCAPTLSFVRPRFDVYREVSQHIRSIFHRYTDIIEPLSLDEAFLDVTEDKQNIGSALDIAGFIKQAIKDELQLTASAGVSVNKFLAKIASDMNKPDGLTFIGPSRIETFMEALPVEKFFGVGKVTAEKMRNMGLHTGADLKKLPEEELTRRFGKAGHFFYKIVRGIDDRPVQPDRQIKSLGAEDTFPYDLETLEEMYVELEKIARTVHSRLQRHNLKGRTVTVKIRYSDFKVITRNQSFPSGIDDLQTILETARQLLAGTFEEDQKIRLLGISLHNFYEPLPRNPGDNSQLPLFRQTRSQSESESGENAKGSGRGCHLEPESGCHRLPIGYP